MAQLRRSERLRLEPKIHLVSHDHRGRHPTRHRPSSLPRAGDSECQPAPCWVRSSTFCFVAERQRTFHSVADDLEERLKWNRRSIHSPGAWRWVRSSNFHARGVTEDFDGRRRRARSWAPYFRPPRAWAHHTPFTAPSNRATEFDIFGMSRRAMPLGVGPSQMTPQIGLGSHRRR